MVTQVDTMSAYKISHSISDNNLSGKSEDISFKYNLTDHIDCHQQNSLSYNITFNNDERKNKQLLYKYQSLEDIRNADFFTFLSQRISRHASIENNYQDTGNSAQNMDYHGTLRYQSNNDCQNEESNRLSLTDLNDQRILTDSFTDSTFMFSPSHRPLFLSSNNENMSSKYFDNHFDHVSGNLLEHDDLFDKERLLVSPQVSTIYEESEFSFKDGQGHSTPVSVVTLGPGTPLIHDNTAIEIESESKISSNYDLGSDIISRDRYCPSQSDNKTVTTNSDSEMDESIHENDSNSQSTSREKWSDDEAKCKSVDTTVTPDFVRNEIAKEYKCKAINISMPNDAHDKVSIYPEKTQNSTNDDVYDNKNNEHLITTEVASIELNPDNDEKPPVPKNNKEISPESKIFIDPKEIKTEKLLNKSIQKLPNEPNTIDIPKNQSISPKTEKKDKKKPTIRTKSASRDFKSHSSHEKNTSINNINDSKKKTTLVPKNGKNDISSRTKAKPKRDHDNINKTPKIEFRTTFQDEKPFKLSERSKIRDKISTKPLDKISLKPLQASNITASRIRPSNSFHDYKKYRDTKRNLDSNKVPWNTSNLIRDDSHVTTIYKPNYDSSNLKEVYNKYVKTLSLFDIKQKMTTDHLNLNYLPECIAVKLQTDNPPEIIKRMNNVTKDIRQDKESKKLENAKEEVYLVNNNTNQSENKNYTENQEVDLQEDNKQADEIKGDLQDSSINWKNSDITGQNNTKFNQSFSRSYNEKILETNLDNDIQISKNVSDNNLSKLNDESMNDSTEYKRSYKLYSPLEMCHYKSFKDKITKDHIISLFRKMSNNVFKKSPEEESLKLNKSYVGGDSESPDNLGHDHIPTKKSSLQSESKNRQHQSTIIQNIFETCKGRANVTNDNVIDNVDNNDNLDKSQYKMAYGQKKPIKSCVSDDKNIWANLKNKIMLDHLTDYGNKGNMNDYTTEYLREYKPSYEHKTYVDTLKSSKTEGQDVSDKQNTLKQDTSYKPSLNCKLIKARNNMDHINSNFSNYKISGYYTEYNRSFSNPRLNKFEKVPTHTMLSYHQIKQNSLLDHIKLMYCCDDQDKLNPVTSNGTLISSISKSENNINDYKRSCYLRR
ncbi:unnamed protein product [Gordionus sp. m RMFG-2023]|uniref:uncharacterized protein PF3D7_1120600-like n=1 Tax=Gordionus sp. m RMFG-2023 TaxID=3053472 RepID=UPI0030DF3420